MSSLPAVVEDAAIIPADQHPAFVYLSRLAPRSRRTQAGALNTIAALLSNGQQTMQTLAWEQIRYQHSQLLRSTIASRYAVATSNRMLAALRGVLQECWRLGSIDAETYRRAADIAPVRGTPAPHGRALAREELTALLEACAADASAAGRRDAALIALLYACGLRRSEAVALDVADYRRGDLLVRRGKGNKSRTCYPADFARALVDAWLDVRGRSGYPLFVRIVRRGIITGNRLSDQSVRIILQRRGKQAGIEAFSPHDVRRTFVGDLLDAGVDLSTVQQLAGHSQVTTTARYDRRGDVAKRKAAALLSIPSNK